MRLDSLRRVYEGTEYYASVYLDVSRAGEDAAEAVALRWPAAAQRLSEAGADQAAVGALGPLVADPARSEPGVAAFARADGAVAFAAARGRR